MNYKIILHPDVVAKDLVKVSNAQHKLVFKQFKKLQTSPELGQLLDNKNGYDLKGCRKLYVDKKKVRIVYSIFEAEIVVEVIAVGKRDDMDVYKKASERK